MYAQASIQLLTSIKDIRHPYTRYVPAPPFANLLCLLTRPAAPDFIIAWIFSWLGFFLIIGLIENYITFSRLARGLKARRGLPVTFACLVSRHPLEKRKRPPLYN